jgi:hypothetical protein
MGNELWDRIFIFDFANISRTLPSDTKMKKQPNFVFVKRRHVVPTLRILD